MAKGKFTDQNLAWTAAFSGGSWIAGLPATNLAQAERFKERPARTTSLTLAHTKFEAALARPRGIMVVALLFHSMSLSAKYRLTVAGAAGTLAAPVYQSAWTDVYGRIFKSAQLPWESANWWTGKPLLADLDLYPRHKFIILPQTIIASAIRVELDDQDSEAGFIDIGGCWISSGFSPQFNIDRGRGLALDSRDQAEEGPSGRMFGRRRQGRRRLAVSWSNLSEGEAQRLFDAGARAGTTRPVLFIPDIDNAASLYREAWPATFERPPDARFTYPGLHQVPATFREIIA